MGEIDWWCGQYDPQKQFRIGRSSASRNGYIIIAPMWSRNTQRRYEYSVREHGRVLAAYRDAIRRVNIDVDRVFIAGHNGGGTAAWDIAVSHPDLWAGMISIGAEPNHTLRHYSDNGHLVPLYVVTGQIAGSPIPMDRYGKILDEYMRYKNNTMVVMYRGRGPEDYIEELPHLMKWMGQSVHRRGRLPEKIETVTMRRCDSSFYWIEMNQMNEDILYDPLLWKQYGIKKTAARVTGTIHQDNTIRIFRMPASQYTIWVHPQMGLNFGETIRVQHRNRSAKIDFDSTVDVMLEDARTRGDRKRPFWAKAVIP